MWQIRWAGGGGERGTTCEAKRLQRVHWAGLGSSRYWALSSLSAWEEGGMELGPSANMLIMAVAPDDVSPAQS